MLNKITLPCVFGQKIQINNNIVIEIFESNKQLKMNIIGAHQVHRRELYETDNKQEIMQQASTEGFGLAQGRLAKGRTI